MMSIGWLFPIFLSGTVFGVWLTKKIVEWVDEVTHEAFEEEETRL